jgi:hypothetical protein
MGLKACANCVLGIFTTFSNHFFSDLPLPLGVVSGVFWVVCISLTHFLFSLHRFCITPKTIVLYGFRAKVMQNSVIFLHHSLHKA